MKKIDKLVFTSFIGPFVLTFFVVVFILLTQFMLKYFDDIVGKDLSVDVLAQLIFYFSIFVTQNALPLAVLLSSLMTFGNLGEHFELTALKGAGISLLRTMRSLFVFSLIFMVLGFFNNNYIIPKANLEAFSLLYDIKQKKPTLDIKEGVFYDGIPGYSIKINEKFADDETLKDIIIYNHIGTSGNKKVTLADSGKMYNILDNRYLVFELFNGENYSEQRPAQGKNFDVYGEPSPFMRSRFDKTKMVFDLSGFDLKRTRKELFANNRLMLNIKELNEGLDSMNIVRSKAMREIKANSYRFFNYHMQEEMRRDTSLTPKKIERQDDEDELEEEEEIEQENDNGNPRQELAEDTDAEDGNEENAGANGLKSIKEKLIASNSDTTAAESSQDTLLSAKQDSATSKKDKDNTVKFKHISPELAKRYNKLQKTKQIVARKNSQTTQDNPEKADQEALLEMDTAALTSRNKALAEVWNKISDTTMQIQAINKALNQSRYAKSHLSSRYFRLNDLIRNIRKFRIERYKKFSMAFTIMAMFLIGAPLGAIIKRGGLGMPVLLSIFFFIMFYVFSILGEKWARQGLISELFGVWIANLILLPIGLLCLKQARKDARLFDADYYVILFDKIRKKLGLKKNRDKSVG